MAPDNHTSTEVTEQHTDEVILGIDFGGTKVALGLADPVTGALLAEHRLDTNAPDGAEQAVRRAVTAARELIAGQPTARLRAVGVVSPGIVLPDRILLAPNVPGWGSLRLRDEIAQRLGIPAPIAVGTDAKAAALAEWRWGALTDADPALFLSLGTGLAAAIVVGGTILTGANGAAGEIGYNLRGVEDSGGHASGSASLEEAVGGRWLGERASALLGRPTTAAELFARAEHDEAAQVLMTEALDELAVHVANLAIAIDPARIAVGGGFTRSAEVVFPALRRRLVQAVPFPPALVPARFEQDGALRGAVALAMSVRSESIENDHSAERQVTLPAQTAAPLAMEGGMPTN
ncbi:MAG TPA: ROK family protein [Pseudonocardiaceae bacterium]|nr:ROK family protein [Pseudonocardiaceae bacterium]